jgi:peptidoglycan LD-endopeptidase CwlK
MAYKLGNRSLDNLANVHPELVKIVQRAIELTKQDFLVLEGVRTPARQKELYAQGRTRPGRKVTWTLNSNHFINKATGFGHAVDIVPWPIDWSDTKKFDEMSKAMFAAAKEQGTGLRWGADWDGDKKPREKGEYDSPHFELK